jgi:hypothetical protein
MGGNALKSIETKRLDANEYHALVPGILDTIRGVVGADRPVAEIVAYRTKPNFGDMDVLVASDGIRTDYKDELERVFRSREVYRNGNVTSFDVDSFQVDVIAIQNKSFEFAHRYFSWNDMGNLMGRIAHKMGAKLGFDGFYMPLRDGTHQHAEVTITHDFDAATRFLGFDPKRHRAGFDDLQKIYEFTISTPYFNPDIFLLENRNATSRVRDAKRKTYSGFLDWLADEQGLKAFMKGRTEPLGGWYQFPEDKSLWIPSLRDQFPAFGQEFDAAMLKKDRHAQSKALFSGERVTELTGLVGKELGEFMQEFRKRHAPDKEALDDWVLSKGKQGVEDAIFQTQQDMASTGRKLRP